MAPQRKSGGGGTPGEKQQRSIASFFSPSPAVIKKPVLIVQSTSSADNPENGKIPAEDPSGPEQSDETVSSNNGQDEPVLSNHGGKRKLGDDAKKVDEPSFSETPEATSPPETKVGKRLRVYWPLEDKMFSGVVAAYNTAAGTHKVTYDDGDEEELVLNKEKVEWIDKAGRKITRRTSQASEGNATPLVGETEAGGGGGYKRLRKRYVASSSEESDHQTPKEDNTPSKLLTLEGNTSDPAKRRKIMEESNPESGSCERLRPDMFQLKDSKAEATGAGVDCHGGARAMVLSGEALERFGSRVPQKFWFLGKDRKDASGRRPDSPNYDPRTLFLPSEFCKGLTGGQKQWWEFKAKHMDKVLLFKMGKFYEMFEMDAHVGAQDLDLQYMKGEQPHCGFPEKNYFDNVERLVRKGHRVLVVEQTETPEQLDERKRKTGAKDKVVRREICAIITRGTIVDSGMVGDNADPSYLLAITEKPNDEGGCLIGLCIVDTSRALFMLGQVLDDSARSKLRSVLTELRPVELVQPRRLLSEATLKALREQTRKPLVSELVPSKEFWDAEQTVKEMEGREEAFPPVLRTLIDLGTMTEPAVSAFGGCISYLKQALLDSQLLRLGRMELLPGSELSLELSRPSISSDADVSSKYMVLDSAALENLEILENSSNSGVSGTLLSLLDHCITPFGRRLLRQWIVRPLLDIHSIVERQTAIQDITGVVEQAVSDFRKELTGIPDLEKLLARLAANSAANGRNASNVVLYEDAAKKQVKELIAALRGCQKMIKAVSCFNGFLNELKSARLRYLLSFGKGFPHLEPHLQYFEDAFDWSEAESTGRVAVPETSDSPAGSSDPKRCLEKYLKAQRKFFNNAEISYVTVGKDTYLLEIPDELHAKVPSQYELRSSKKGYRRYWTPRIKELLQELNSSENERETALKGVLQELTKRFCEHHTHWLSAIRAVSELDALMSLSCARLHIDGSVCVPKFLAAEERCFNAKSLRHPIVAVGAAAGNPFVPNDVVLGGGNPHFMLLTGPNMGGKSTLLRQVCLAMILAQIGAEVPAETLELSPTDRLFVRMGAKDHIMSAQSTFLVELSETASMLRCATRDSFVALDELGRGTATSDGQAIAHAVLDYLARTVQCRGMFSSHYHRLADDHTHDQAIALHHMACEVSSGVDATEAVTFLYKLTPGLCPKSYGVNVARLAGMPQTVLRRATVHSSKLEQEENSRSVNQAEALNLIRSVISCTNPDLQLLTPLWETARRLLLTSV